MTISKAKANALTGKKILVKQTRSFIGRDQEVRGTLRALGLGRIGSTCEHTANASVLGMIRRVSQIVTVTKTGK